MWLPRSCFQRQRKLQNKTTLLSEEVQWPLLWDYSLWLLSWPFDHPSWGEGMSGLLYAQQDHKLFPQIKTLLHYSWSMPFTRNCCCCCLVVWNLCDSLTKCGGNILPHRSVSRNSHHCTRCLITCQRLYCRCLLEFPWILVTTPRCRYYFLQFTV